MSISTVFKSLIKNIPPIKKLITERDELRLKIAEGGKASSPAGFTSPLLNKHKLGLIDYAFTSLQVRSFADLGGVWGVDGGYTFYALDRYNLSKAVLVDNYHTDETREQSKNHPQLRFLQGYFGDKQIAHDVGQVDAIFMFDILLHQVAPDWDQILEMYASQTQCLVIFNQQWVGSDSTVRLLDLGEEEYFRSVPYNKTQEPYNNLFQKLNQKHPDHERVWKDAFNIWQWGITDADLQSKVKSLGFHLQFFKNCGPTKNVENFENLAYVFSKASPGSRKK
jgi:hypothetical protein